jgi:hypothetical protein
MYESKAAYGPKPIARRGMTLGLFVQWVAACVFGAVVGQALAQLLASALLSDFREPNFYSFIVGIVAGAVMGACIGIAQGAALARRIGSGGWRDWILASMVGGAVRWAVLSPVIATLLNVRTGWRSENTTDIAASTTDICVFFFAMIVFGMLSGIAFAIPQAYVLRRRLGTATELDGPAWGIANAIGGVLILPVVSLSGLNDAGTAILVGVAAGALNERILITTAITWLLIGLATAIPLNDRLRGTPE